MVWQVWAVVGLVVTALVGGVAPPQATALQAPEERLVVTGLSSFGDAAEAAAVAATAEAVLDRVRGAAPIAVEPLEAAAAAVVRVPADRAEAARAALSADPRLSAEPDVPATVADVAPDDPWWPHQAEMRQVALPEAWEATTGGPGVTVAVLDTGVDPAHPDLDGALAAGHNVVDPGAEPVDVNGHGTAVAGIAAARGDNGEGIAGYCWDCAIMPVKVLGDDGRGWLADVAEGVHWATDAGADIINLSLGSTSPLDALADAVAYANAEGVVVVAAAGNDGATTLTYPAAYDSVIGVAGVDGDDQRDPDSNHGEWVTVAAPFCHITLGLGGTYQKPCGTSTSAPAVAGLAALVLTMDPDAPVDEVRGRIEAAGIPVDFVAHGRIDAAATLAPETPALSFSDTAVDLTAESGAAVDAEVSVAADGGGVAALTVGSDAEWLNATPMGQTTPATVEITADATDLDAGAYEATVTAHADDYQPATLAVTFQVTSATQPEPEPGPETEPESEPEPEPACPEGEVPPSGFSDVAGNTHEGSVDCVAWYEIARGATSTTYQPGRDVRRDQLASLVVAQLRVAGVVLPEPDGPAFHDTAGNTHERSIAQLAELEVVQGVTATRYEPARSVTRDQMATFLWRAHQTATGEALPVTSRHFDDTDDTVHRDSIDALASAGVVSGRGDGVYDPSRPVRRDQMASFLANHLELLATSGLVAHPQS